MTDEPESPDVSEVRRLLAEARHTEPMPDDVAARLDDVLAGLARPEAAAAADVVPLAARRRRKVAGWLVAAAAVVVGGAVVAPHLPTHSSSSPAAAGDAAPRNSEVGNTGNAQRTGPHGSNGTAPGPLKATHGGPVVVRPRHFSADALATRERLLARVDSYDAGQAVSCADVPRGQDSVAAEYRHAAAALVFRRPSAGVQVVELYLCGHGEPVRSTTLPVP